MRTTYLTYNLCDAASDILAVLVGLGEGCPVERVVLAG